MSAPEISPQPARQPDPDGEGTGLPGVRTWPRLYGLVLGSFILWLALLTWLTRSFQ